MNSGTSGGVRYVTMQPLVQKCQSTRQKFSMHQFGACGNVHVHTCVYMHVNVGLPLKVQHASIRCMWRSTYVHTCVYMHIQCKCRLTVAPQVTVEGESMVWFANFHPKVKRPLEGKPHPLASGDTHSTCRDSSASCL